MNEDHADATRLYATKLLGEEGGPWRITGLDPDGARSDGRRRTARLPFRERVTEPGAMRKALVALAKEARATT